MATSELTHEYVRRLFNYDAAGCLIWRERPLADFSCQRACSTTNSLRAGRVAGRGSANSDGYLELGIDGRIYKTHRVIWFWHHGTWPVETDRINGNRVDNRIENLRDSTRTENMKNKKINRNNTSGEVGVSWHPNDERWIASVRLNGKSRRIGGYKTFDEAVQARRKASVEYGFHENHGRKSAL